MAWELDAAELADLEGDIRRYEHSHAHDKAVQRLVLTTLALLNRTIELTAQVAELERLHGVTKPDYQV
jgi:hypothetical protein